MTVEEIMYNALSATGIEVTQPPVKGKAERYLSWNLTAGTYTAYASDVPQRARIACTVHLYSRKAPTTDDRQHIFNTLEAHRVRINGWGAIDYEDDTGLYHMPVNVLVFMKGR